MSFDSLKPNIPHNFTALSVVCWFILVESKSNKVEMPCKNHVNWIVMFVVK